MMVPTFEILGNLAMQPGRESYSVPTVDGAAPIEEVIESFLGSQIPKKTTARGYRRHLLHAFGMMAVETLGELEPVMLMAFRRYLIADGRGNATHAQKG